jgi:5,10-methylenetetrahydromethanopterin reductase
VTAETQDLTFGTGTTPRDFESYREWLDVAESSGCFSLLTTGDSQSLWAEPFVALTYAATLTRRPQLGITVTNPMTRHPAVAASAAVALQQLSGGRFRYGIGTGDSALRNIGVRTAQLEELEEYVLAVRSLTRTGQATWRGNRLRLDWAQALVPIWIAAEGPRSLRLAGRIADGVILSNCLTRERSDWAMGLIAEGAAASGRNPEEIEVWWMANVVPSASVEDGVRSIRSVLAGTANHAYRHSIEDKGVPESLRDAIAQLQARYDSSVHANPALADHNAQLVDELGLRDWLAAQSTIAGPPSAIIERLREVRSYGVRRILLGQFVADPLAFMRTFAIEIAPSLDVITR